MVVVGATAAATATTAIAATTTTVDDEEEDDEAKSEEKETDPGFCPFGSQSRCLTSVLLVAVVTITLLGGYHSCCALQLQLSSF